MKFWWLTDKARLGVERRAVEEIAQEGWFQLDRWGVHDDRLCALGTITAHGHTYPIRLLYPDQFPEVPAWVEPQQDASWTSHQYGSGGLLCLELRPDNWVATATGADVLRSAYGLLDKEDPLGNGNATVPSAHNIGELQRYDWGANPVLIGEGCRDRIRGGIAVDLRALRWMANDDVWPILIHDAEDRTSPRRPPGADLQTWRVEMPVFVSDNQAPDAKIDRAALIAAGGFGTEATALLGELKAMVLLFRGGKHLVVFNLVQGQDPSRRLVYVLPEEAEVRTNRSARAQGKRVAIVGAGSVGSKLAEVLVRAGVSQFTLVDGDVLLPANLERHALDWRDVGFRKAHGLKRKLLHIAPGADVTVVDANLNWQRSAKIHARQIASVADCDLIVDATGDPATSLFLGAVANANKRPFVSVEVFEGGIGALVATSLPERDPPFAHGRAIFLAWCDEKNVKPPERGARRYEALAGDGTPIVADDAAVTMTAGHAARIVLDILDGHPPQIEAAWLLLGYAKGWLFDGHGQTIRLSVGPRADQAPAARDEETEQFQLRLVKEWMGETRISTAITVEADGGTETGG